MTRTVFDIETAPLPEAEILPLAPEFVAPSNYKDQAKIDAYIAQAKYDWLDKTALSPVTGRVVAIGYLVDGSMMLDIEPSDERRLLVCFWELVQTQWCQTQFVGFNIKRFDLPFLVRRSWRLDIAPPKWIRRGRYWDGDFVDLFEEWQLGNGQDSISLNTLSKFLGIGEKAGNGANFHKLSRVEQETYLGMDLELTAKAAARMLPTPYAAPKSDAVL